MRRSLLPMASLIASAVAAVLLPVNAVSCTGGSAASPSLSSTANGSGPGGVTADGAAGPSPDDAATDSPAADGGLGPLPFSADPPNVYVAKVKNVLVGLPPTDAEVQAVAMASTPAQAQAQLGTLVDGWMQLPQYQTKLLRFFELAFQQTQVASADFSDQIFPAQIDPMGATAPVMLQSFQESFARTMLQVATTDSPFNQAAMSTQTFALTTALKVFYAFQDVWQVGNLVGCGVGAAHDAFKQANPNLKMYVTANGPIPLSESVDPMSPNYMHWYDPDVTAYGVAAKNTPGCQVDPIVYGADARYLYYVLLGELGGQPSTTGTGQCQVYQKGTQGPLQPADFQDWTMTTIQQPTNGQATTAFYDLPTLRTATTLVLHTPRVGFFTTPAFFANWQTNTSNEARVTINQTFIVSTGAQVDGTDSTSPPTTPGLDSAHAAPGSMCFLCHQLLDPSRSIFSSTYSWNFGLQTDPMWTGQPGLFAFQGVIAPMSTIYDLGNILSTHPLVASGWAEKLCYYINSEACTPTDPEFQLIVNTFKSGYSWNQLLKAVLVSPITTHAATSQTATTNGEVVAVTRRDHLCAAWNARLGFQDICGLNVTVPPVLPGAALAVVPSLPSDGYARGTPVPILPNEPTLFFRSGVENLCEAIANVVVDNNNPPAGATTWSSANATAAINEFATLVSGLAPSDPRTASLQQMLQSHFTSAKQVSGMTATSALRSTFIVACMAPPAVSMGM